MIAVPALVEQRARACGEPGGRWLESLPTVLAEIAERWGLTIGAPLAGGTASLVVDALAADGRPCVVKLWMPTTDGSIGSFERAVTAHRLAGGVACAELFAADADRQALLLERLGPNLHEYGLTVAEVIEVVADTLAGFWRPVDDDASHGLTAGDDAVDWLAQFIPTTWADLGRPCDRALVDQALRYCDERRAAFDPARSVLVHGDAHGWNTLVDAEHGFKLVDPEGLCSERAHDLGVLMREYNHPLLRGDTPALVRDRALWLAERCATEVEAVWQWGFIERVSTGLANWRDFDDRDDAAAFFEVARRCL